MLGHVRYNDIGTVFAYIFYDQDGEILNIGPAIDITIYFQRPDLTSFTKTGTLETDGSDGIAICTTVDGDINQTGDGWRTQGKIEMPLGTWMSEPYFFSVGRNIPEPAP